MSFCKLIIQDEVNIKFEGLPAEVRRKLSNTFKFEKPGAKYHPAYKLGRWDGTTTLFGVGGNGYLAHLPRILDVLTASGYEISEIVDQRHPVQLNFGEVTETYWADRGIVWPKGHPDEGKPVMLRDYQVSAINTFLKNPQSLQEIATGAGKCQPLTSKVLTPAGWRQMGSIVAGDDVITPAGKSVKVLETFTPGIKEVYEITFSDGRTVRSCADHIWPIYNIEWGRTRTGPIRNISTAEVIKLLMNTKRKIGVPLVSMVEDVADIDLPIDPWLLGFLLGDGSFRNGKLCFSTADEELLSKVRAKLDLEYEVKHIANYDYCIKFKHSTLARKLHSENMCSKNRNTQGHILPNQPSSSNMYIKKLMELGLMETYSHTKFIPELYFSASINQRLELIRGLVDSDGTIDKASVKFSSTSKMLVEGFQTLIWSIGGVAKISSKSNTTYMYNGVRVQCKDSFTVATRYHSPWELTSLTRKKNATNFSYQYGPTLKLNIDSVKKVSTEQVKCIMIDDPMHLYVTDNYVVTHNTITTATLSHLCEALGRTVTIVPNKGLVEQTEEDFINCGLDVGVYYGDRKDLNKTHTICTWQSLNILNKKSKNDEHEILTLAEFLDNVKTVIVDEVHMAQATVLKDLLTQNLQHACVRWGLTGTVPKEPVEYESIFASIGPVVGGITASELQERGVLSNCHVNVMQLIDLKEFRSYAEEYDYLVTNNDRIDYVASFIEQIALTGNTLVLVNRIETGTMLQTRLSNLFSVLADAPEVSFVSGAVKSTTRKEAYDEVRTSQNKVIIATYGVAAVGINIPRIFNLVLIEPGKSFVRVIQSIGRGIRKAADKDFVEIWDITSTCKYAKRHLTERKKYYRDAKYQFTIKKVDWK